MNKPLILLASNSPRRRELLALTGWQFRVSPSNVDETLLPGEQPRDYVTRLAQTKARAALPRALPGEVVLAADTIVVDGETVLGKPADARDAARILARLRGRVHQVYTCLAALRPTDGALLTDLCVTDVPMRAYTEEEMGAYIAGGDPFDKAGAYAIQHADFHPVEALHGCYASVMGLPLCHLTRIFQRLDISPAVDVPAACQMHLGYACPIFLAVLRGDVIG